MYYYGARYYDPRLSIFISVDPLAEEYPNIGGYVYVANNPINFIDPDGRDIKICYNQKKDVTGKMIADVWTFNGKNAHTAPNNQFVRDFLAAYNYNTKNGGGDNMKIAAFDETSYFVYEIDPMISSYSTFENGQHMLKWNSLTGLMVKNGDILSPATILEHEFDHAVSKVKNLIEHEKHYNTYMENYSNAEEYRVITGSETKTAKANGKISRNKYQSRYTHGIENSFVPVKSPTSNKIRNTKERTNNKKYEIVKGLYHYE